SLTSRAAGVCRCGHEDGGNDGWHGARGRGRESRASRSDARRDRLALQFSRRSATRTLSPPLCGGLKPTATIKQSLRDFPKSKMRPPQMVAMVWLVLDGLFCSRVLRSHLATRWLARLPRAKHSGITRACRSQPDQQSREGACGSLSARFKTAGVDLV